MMQMFDPSNLAQPVPVFPLPNCVLLPGAMLPLYVFEHRYRVMVKDILYKPASKRWLAVALLQPNCEALYHTNEAPIEPVVGVGRLVQHRELPDGCCNILLAGQARARVVLEDVSGPYRSASLKPFACKPVNLLDSVSDAVEQVRSLLGDVAAMGERERQVVDAVVQPCASPERMIDVAAFHLLGPEKSDLKQRILSEPEVEVRAEILATELRALLADRQAQRPDWPPSINHN